MKLKLASLFLVIALALPPEAPGLSSAWASTGTNTDRSEQVAIRIAQLSPGTIKYLREGQAMPVVPVRRRGGGGALVAGLIIGAVVGAAVARSATKKRYKRRYGKRKYRRYW